MNDELMRRAGGVWEPGARQWLVERRRMGPVIRELERIVDPLFRQAGFGSTDARARLLGHTMRALMLDRTLSQARRRLPRRLQEGAVLRQLEGRVRVQHKPTGPVEPAE